MPTYKLYYFPGKGRAELSRLLFAAACIQYEDNRISGDEWAKVKPTTVTGKMPFLDVDGAQLPEGDAIARYIAREHGLAGKTSWEVAQADVILGVCNDLRKEMVQAHFEKDEKLKAEKQTKLGKETFPNYLAVFEKILNKNSNKDGYFVGKSLTIADLAVYDLLDFPISKGFLSLENNATLKSHRQKISEIPRIAEWLKKRPASEF
ncbi:hypothetical protein ScPMuIL_008622 [Solemya velum]